MYAVAGTHDFIQFFDAYVECALWSSTDDAGHPLDTLESVESLAPETLARMKDDCINFFRAHREDLERHGTFSQGGHDFALTREGHGTGYWDRGTGAVGERLTEAAHAYGPIDLYVGDDNLIYSS